MEYIRAETISLKNHPEFNERWLQSKIEDDPAIMGLGDLILRDSERIQPSGGRLDLLLHDPESNRRYEVELQLGKSDESHIIRTIEYWDYERKRYPQYDHCAVLIAEDITSRFLNVISLFNGFIPIIAIQLKALRINNNVSIIFTTVIDEFSLGTDEEDEQEIVNRNYWELKGSKESLRIADMIMEISNNLAPGFSLKYNKQYIGVAKDGIPKNFISFIPRKNSIILHANHEQDDDVQRILDSSDLDILDYDRRYKNYRIRLKELDVENNKDILVQLIKKSYEYYMS